MVLITNTNIVVDDFSYGKANPYLKYIYFLTHFHSGTQLQFPINILDHWAGITQSWNYGKIYCSEMTKRLLLNKFPTIQNVVTNLRELF